MKSLEELIEEIKREARGEPIPEEETPSHVEPPRFEIPPPPETESLRELGETEPPVEPEPFPQPEPPIVEPRPPLPEPEPEDDEASAISESDFDILLDIDFDPERPIQPPPSTLGGPPRVDLRPAPLEAEPLEPEVFEPLPEPVPETRTRVRLAKGLRYALPIVVLAGLVTGGVILFSGDEREPAARGVDRPVGTSADQDVVAWSVWDGQTTEGAFVTVVAVGGDKPPVALGVPAYTMANIPGYGTGTVGDAIAAQGRDRGAAAVENILGVGVDASAFSTLGDLSRIIDGLGGITVAESTMNGEEALRYLMRGGGGLISAEFQFLRWQELVAGMLDAVDGRTDVFASLGPEVGPVLAAAGSAGAEVLELPVIDIGSGLARPDADEVQRIVEERFVPTARTTREVRLVVLNGVGTPGIGERVTNILVPAGFTLVGSENAQSFDEKETRIVATSQDFLPEAELARELLGVGEVFIGVQPTGLADVTVIVGADFGGS